MERYRPDWDDLWMSIAFAVAQRSRDTSTAHGCVIVDKDNKVLSLGYNSWPVNCKDEEVPQSRPKRYSYVIHSETNAIINSNTSLKGATAYITGHPCERCFGNMINAGIKHIVYGCVGSHCIKEEHLKIIDFINTDREGNKKITLKKYENTNNLLCFFNAISEYIIERNI